MCCLFAFGVCLLYNAVNEPDAVTVSSETYN